MRKIKNQNYSYLFIIFFFPQLIGCMNEYFSFFLYIFMYEFMYDG